MIHTVDRTDAERAVICAVFQQPELIGPLSEILTGSDFKSGLLAGLFDQAAKMFRAGEIPADRLLLGRYALSPGFRDGDIEYLAKSIIDYTPHPLHAMHYAKRVLESSVQLQAEDALDKARTNLEVDSTIAESSRVLFDAQQRLAKARGAATIETTVVKAASQFLETATSARGSGVPSALAGIDEWLGGPITLGSLVILGALPGNGKTLFMLQSLMRAARARHRCVFFSQEMSEEQIGERIVSMITGMSREMISLKDIATMKKEITEELHGADIILRSVQPTSSAICSAMEREATENGTTVFGIDYLQLLKGVGKSRYEQITSLCSDVKSATARLGVVTYLASQLNREAVKEKPPLPRAQYLRDSGQIEADADVILGLRYPRKDSSQETIADKLVKEQKQFDPEEYFEIYCWKIRSRQLPQGRFECRLQTNPLKLCDQEMPSNYVQEFADF